jgi:hypothetical protein
MIEISNFSFYFCDVSLNFSLGVAMDYGLDDRALITGRGKIFLFSTASRPALRHTQSRI